MAWAFCLASRDGMDGVNNYLCLIAQIVIGLISDTNMFVPEKNFLP